MGWNDKCHIPQERWLATCTLVTCRLGKSDTSGSELKKLMRPVQIFIAEELPGAYHVEISRWTTCSFPISVDAGGIEAHIQDDLRLAIWILFAHTVP